MKVEAVGAELSYMQEMRETASLFGFRGIVVGVRLLRIERELLLRFCLLLFFHAIVSCTTLASASASATCQAADAHGRIAGQGRRTMLATASGDGIGKSLQQNKLEASNRNN